MTTEQWADNMTKNFSVLVVSSSFVEMYFSPHECHFTFMYVEFNVFFIGQFLKALVQLMHHI